MQGVHAQAAHHKLAASIRAIPRKICGESNACMAYASVIMVANILEHETTTELWPSQKSTTWLRTLDLNLF